MPDDPSTTPTEPDERPGVPDPDGLKDALGRTGRMLHVAGLPFEQEEFDGDDDSSSSSSEGTSSSSSSSSDEELPPAAPPA